MLMSHATYRVESFRIVGPYTLHVTFDDGVEQSLTERRGSKSAPLRDWPGILYPR